MLGSDEFRKDVEAQQAVLTLKMIEHIAENDMPECFGTQRSTLVALARLLMETLRQNEQLATALQADGNGAPVTKH